MLQAMLHLFMGPRNCGLELEICAAPPSLVDQHDLTIVNRRRPPPPCGGIPDGGFDFVTTRPAGVTSISWQVSGWIVPQPGSPSTLPTLMALLRSGSKKTKPRRRLLPTADVRQNWLYDWVAGRSRRLPCTRECLVSSVRDIRKNHMEPIEGIHADSKGTEARFEGRRSAVRSPIETVR